MNKVLLSIVVMFLLPCTMEAQMDTIAFPSSVNIPDSINNVLDSLYCESRSLSIASDDHISVHVYAGYAGSNVWNLLDCNDKVFTDGLYTMKGRGPHFPRRLFIYNNGKIFAFRNNYVDTVLKEYSEYIEEMKLSEVEKIVYLKKISIYLEEEMGETYGAYIKKE